MKNSEKTPRIFAVRGRTCNKIQQTPHNSETSLKSKKASKNRIAFCEVAINSTNWSKILAVQSGMSLQHPDCDHEAERIEGFYNKHRRSGCGDRIAGLGHLALLQTIDSLNSFKGSNGSLLSGLQRPRGHSRKLCRDGATTTPCYNQRSFSNNKAFAFSSLACSAAAANGHLAVLKWLHTCKKLRLTKAVTALALENGHLPVVQWLHSQLTPLFPKRLRNSRCCHKHTRQVPKSQVTFTFRTGALEGAIQRGHLSVLEWCENQGFLTGRRFSSCAMANAAAGGHLDVVEWLASTGKFPRTPHTVDNSASGGHLKVLEWLHKTFIHLPPATTEAMDKAALHGHLKVVEWLHRNRSEGCTRRAMDGAAQNGHLEVVEWLHENRIEGGTTHAMDWAAWNGHLEIVEWLHHHRPEGCTTDAMDHAASMGLLDVVEWLHQHRSEGCTQVAMNHAVQKKLLQIVVWLVRNYPSKCSLGSAVHELSNAYERTKGYAFGNMYPDVSSLIFWLKENNLEVDVSSFT